MKILLGIILYFFVMLSISTAVAVGVVSGMKEFIKTNKTVSKGGKENESI